MSKRSAIIELATRSHATAIVLSDGGDLQVDVVRDVVTTIPFVNVLALMRDTALQALELDPVSPDVADLTFDQATALHALYEVAATVQMLGSPVEDRLAMMTNLSGFITGWEDATGVEFLYTSGLSMVSADVELAAMTSATLLWSEHVQSGAYAEQFGGLLMDSTGTQASLLPGGTLSRLGLTTDASHALAGMHRGAKGWGVGFDVQIGPVGTGGLRPEWNISAGYEDVDFSAGYVPGVMGREGFVPAEFGSDGSFTPAGGMSSVPGVTGVYGPDGFVPGALIAESGQLRIVPGGVGTQYFPGSFDGQSWGGGACPIDESYLSENYSGFPPGYGAGLSAQGEQKASFGAALAIAGVTVAAGGIALAATTAWTGVGLKAGVATAAVGAALVHRGMETHHQGQEMIMRGHLIEGQQQGGGHTTSGTPSPHPEPHHDDVGEYLEYAQQRMQLPSAWKGLFPDINCPDPFGGGLLSQDEIGLSLDVDWVTLLEDGGFAVAEWTRVHGQDIATRTVWVPNELDRIGEVAIIGLPSNVEGEPGFGQPIEGTQLQETLAQFVRVAVPDKKEPATVDIAAINHLPFFQAFVWEKGSGSYVPATSWS